MAIEIRPLALERVVDEGLRAGLRPAGIEQQILRHGDRPGMGLEMTDAGATGAGQRHPDPGPVDLPGRRSVHQEGAVHLGDAVPPGIGQLARKGPSRLDWKLHLLGTNGYVRRYLGVRRLLIEHKVSNTQIKYK